MVVEEVAWVLIRKRFKVVGYLSGIAVGANRHDVMVERILLLPVYVAHFPKRPIRLWTRA